MAIHGRLGEGDSHRHAAGFRNGRAGPAATLPAALRRDLPRPVTFDLLEPQPDDPPASIDITILEAATDLQHRLEEARRRLMPPGEPARSSQETRQKIEQIILEEYHRKSDPADALARVRRFLSEQGGGEREAGD